MFPQPHSVISFLPSCMSVSQSIPSFAFRKLLS
nr:MAG TPA: hypothetical protein [Caudoviricetes sp.]